MVKFIRLTLILLLTGTFIFLAYFLYQLQQNKYSFLSFRLNEVSSSIVVPDLDRLLNKLENSSDIESIEVNETLKSGFDQLLQQRGSGFNEDLGDQCFLSFNQNDFVLAFENPDLNFHLVVGILNKVFLEKASYADGIIDINGKQYYAENFGVYTVFSSQPILPVFTEDELVSTNADYIVVRDTGSVERFILANDRQFKVWNETSDPVRGNPVNHNAFIKKIPTSFQDVFFYGSHRLRDDKISFFKGAEEEEYSWISDGVLILRKDSFQLMIAPQNDERNLRLILEEQTLKAKGDTVQLNFFNVKNFEIMPFETSFNWQKSIPELTTELSLYTEFENFNVLANSLSAMRWYLAEIQTGNLLEEDEEIMEQYRLSTPLRSHFVHITNHTDALLFETATWVDKTTRVRTLTNVSLMDDSTRQINEDLEFQVAFAPDVIIPFTQKGASKLLIANKKNLAMYNDNGNMEWNVELPSETILDPVLIDLENDDIFEIALFLNNTFIVFNSQGQIISGLHKKIDQPVLGGLCVNYDLAYNYRFFVVTSNSIVCLNENGETVTGWQFSNPTTPLSGEASYTQISGIDFLTFGGVNGQLLVLNRRGESRFENQVVSKLSNESDFVTGTNEGTLHKLGYANQYIYNRYLKDGYTDSVKLDKRVNAIAASWIMLDKPNLLIDEPNRIILFNEFGYVEREILKPQDASEFLGIESTIEIQYVFANSSNKILYLLNQEGKIILSNPYNSEVYGISPTGFYTYDRLKMKKHKLN